MKTLPVHCMVGKSSYHLVCMSCSQLCHEPTSFLVTSIVLKVNLYIVTFVILLILWFFFTVTFYPVYKYL